MIGLFFYRTFVQVISLIGRTSLTLSRKQTRDLRRLNSCTIRPEILDSIRIRRVTAEDYGKVIEIRKGIYGGYDYLPYLYKHIIEMPNNHGYAVDINNRLVAFIIASIVDGGQTIVQRASRTSRHYEGLGLSKLLSNFIRQKYCMGEDLNDAGALVGPKRIDSGEYTLIMKMEGCHYKMKKIALNLSEPKYSRILTAIDLECLFMKNEICSNIFPENRIVSHAVPFRILQSNIPSILNECDLLIGSFTKECVLVTVGTYFQCENGTIFNIEIYGEVNEFFSEHLTLYLKFLSNFDDYENIEFVFWLRTKQLHNFNGVFEEYGFKRIEGVANEYLYVGEKNKAIKI